MLCILLSQCSAFLPVCSILCWGELVCIFFLVAWGNLPVVWVYLTFPQPELVFRKRFQQFLQILNPGLHL